jgi:hypothetical protein
MTLKVKQEPIGFFGPLAKKGFFPLTVFLSGVDQDLLDIFTTWTVTTGDF